MKRSEAIDKIYWLLIEQQDKLLEYELAPALLEFIEKEIGMLPPYTEYKPPYIEWNGTSYPPGTAFYNENVRVTSAPVWEPE